MDDLLAFLRAIEDERERKANAAAGKAGEPAWSAGGEFTTELVRTAEEGAPVVDGPWGGLSWEMRQHIADNDPAFVLADVTAKRMLIDEILKYEAKIDGEWGCGHGSEEIAAGQCWTISPNEIVGLRILALPHADRPGYQESWRP